MDNFEKGKRTSAGMLLSKFINKIANELSDEAMMDSNGREVPVTNAEKLARVIWQHAMGFVEETVVTEGGERIVKHKEIKPDYRYVAMLWDRLEGKAVSSDNTIGPKKQPKSDEVNEQAEARLKDLAEEV